MRAEADGCNSVKYNLTSDTMSSIFRCYPAGKLLSLLAHIHSPLYCAVYFTVKKKHAQMVPDKVQARVCYGLSWYKKMPNMYFMPTVMSFRCPRVTFG